MRDAISLTAPLLAFVADQISICRSANLGHGGVVIKHQARVFQRALHAQLSNCLLLRVHRLHVRVKKKVKQSGKREVSGTTRIAAKNGSLSISLQPLHSTHIPPSPAQP